jgi:hypothetical protein
MRICVGHLENLVLRRGLYRVWEPAQKGQRTPLVARWIDPERKACDPQEREEAVVGEDPEHIRALLIRARSRGEAERRVCNLSVMCPPDTDSFLDCSASRLVEVRFDTLLSLQRLADGFCRSHPTFIGPCS